MKDREPKKGRTLLILGLVTLLIVQQASGGGVQAESSLDFTAPKISRLGEINFQINNQSWNVDEGSVNVTVPDYNNLIWEANLAGPNGTKKRVECTSGTVFPVSGGSYFEAHCK